MKIVVVGELNIVVTLLGIHGQSFRLSHDRWSSDISRSKFYHFLVSEPSLLSLLFKQHMHVCYPK